MFEGARLSDFSWSKSCRSCSQLTARESLGSRLFKPAPRPHDFIEDVFSLREIGAEATKPGTRTGRTVPNSWLARELFLADAGSAVLRFVVPTFRPNPALKSRSAEGCGM